MSQREAELLRKALPHLRMPLAFDVWVELGDYRAWIRRALETKEALEAQRRKARRQCDRLLSLPPEDQLERIWRSGRPHWSRPLAMELVRRSQEALFEDPFEAVWLAKLAWEVAWKMRRVPELCGGLSGVYDLHALTLAHLGNAHRIACQWPEAAAAFEDAFTRRRQGTADPLLEAEMRWLHGAYLRARRKLPGALLALRTAVRLYRAYGDQALLARTLLSLAIVFNDAENPHQAYSTNLEACRLIDAWKQPRLAVSAWHNQALYCARMGRFEEASFHLHQAPEALERFEPRATDRAQWVWIDGMVKQGLGYRREAEALYLDALGRFQQMKNPYDAGLVALDLARLYFEAGRYQDLARTAEAAWAGLENQGLRLEAEQALVLLVRGARYEQVTAEAIRAAAEALRRNPLERKPPVRARR